MKKGMTFQQFLESFNWTNTLFVLDRVKWVSTDEKGNLIDCEFETVYDERKDNDDCCLPFFNVIIEDIIALPTNDNEIAILRLSESLEKYRLVAKHCKNYVWERYEGACEWLAEKKVTRIS